jgi:hypothetical protein
MKKYLLFALLFFFLVFLFGAFIHYSSVRKMSDLRNKLEGKSYETISESGLLINVYPTETSSSGTAKVGVVGIIEDIYEDGSRYTLVLLTLVGETPFRITIDLGQSDFRISEHTSFYNQGAVDRNSTTPGDSYQDIFTILTAKDLFEKYQSSIGRVAKVEIVTRLGPLPEDCPEICQRRRGEFERTSKNNRKLENPGRYLVGRTILGKIPELRVGFVSSFSLSEQ